jgi:hypothetical protein
MNIEKTARFFFCFSVAWIALALLMGGTRWKFPVPLKQSLKFEREQARFQSKKSVG